jgi:hypothetical protein
MKPHRGVLILVLGILSFVFCGIFTAIPAWLMGGRDLKEMDAGTMDPTGRNLTNVGRILGMIGTLLFLIGVVVVVILMVLGAFGAATTAQ